ncbi:hypothetical protein E4U46_006502 [Claviceps purpurea]|nr:hypothetical protein E4U46_006502 [Claviceps purpurea]
MRSGREALARLENLFRVVAIRSLMLLLHAQCSGGARASHWLIGSPPTYAKWVYLYRRGLSPESLLPQSPLHLQPFYILLPGCQPYADRLPFIPYSSNDTGARADIRVFTDETRTVQSTCLPQFGARSLFRLPASLTTHGLPTSPTERYGDTTTTSPIPRS